MIESSTVWYKYPNKKPEKTDEYLVTVSCGYFNITSSSVWENGRFTDYENEPGKIGSIVAWADLPDPYEGNIYE